MNMFDVSDEPFEAQETPPTQKPEEQGLKDCSDSEPPNGDGESPMDQESPSTLTQQSEGLDSALHTDSESPYKDPEENVSGGLRVAGEKTFPQDSRMQIAEEEEIDQTGISMFHISRIPLFYDLSQTINCFKVAKEGRRTDPEGMILTIPMKKIPRRKTVRSHVT